MQGLCGLLERGKARWGVEVPNGAGHPQTELSECGEIDMANRPASVRADLIQRQLQDRFGTGSLISRGGDGLQQLQQSGTLGYLPGKRGIEGLERFFLPAQGEVLFLEQAVVCLQHLLQAKLSTALVMTRRKVPVERSSFTT